VDGNQSPFTFVEWLLIKAITLTIKPTKILLHADDEPIGPWYDRAKKYITYNHVTPLSVTSKGINITMVQHKSDFVRLEALIKYGGIYLDLDAIPLKSFDKLLKSGYNVILGRTIGNYLGVGLMISMPNATLMRDFYEKSLEVFDGKWTTHSVKLLTNMINEPKYTNDILMLDQNSFFPFSWEEQDRAALFHPDKPEFKWSLSYALHLYNSGGGGIPKDAYTYVITQNTNFNRAVKWMVLKAVEEGEIPTLEEYQNETIIRQ